MEYKEMKRKIIQKIKEEKWLPVIEVERLFEKNEYDYKGDYNLYTNFPDGTMNESVVIWKGWTKEATTMICEILEESNRKIAFKPAFNPIELFCLGGGFINMPIAEDMNKKYKKQHWLPGAYVWLGK